MLTDLLVMVSGGIPVTSSMHCCHSDGCLSLNQTLMSVWKELTAAVRSVTTPLDRTSVTARLVID